LRNPNKLKLYTIWQKSSKAGYGSKKEYFADNDDQTKSRQQVSQFRLPLKAVTLRKWSERAL
jgi:hypothetical protein